MVRNCSEGAVTSRTGRRGRVHSVISPTSMSARVRGSGRVVVVELLLRLLSQESLELRTKLVAARQLLVAPQQRPVLLGVDECIVLALQGRHHLSDLCAR